MCALNLTNSTRQREPFTLPTSSIGSLSLPSKGQSKPPNLAYLDLGVTSEQKKNKTQCLSKSQRLEKKQKTKEILLNLLAQAGEPELVKRIEVCSQKFEVTACESHAVISRKSLHRCDFRLCPFCASRRSRKIVNKYLPRAQSFVRFGKIRVEPVHLVLTQAKRKGEKVRDGRKRLTDSFKKLQKRKFWLNYFAGGIYAVETTVSESGNHVHLHILAFRRRFFDIALLRSEWLKITGDSVNLRLDRVKDLASGLREVIKYVSKPLDIEKFGVKQIREFLELKNQRMFGAFGEFAKFCRTYEKPSDNDETERKPKTCCPICEKPLFNAVMTTKQLIAFTKRHENIPKRL
jgi:plasmid rolling circle replication initiator protein Rep